MRIPLFLAVCLCSTANTLAAVHISLVPIPNEPTYEPGQELDVEVFAQLTPGGPESIRVRLMRFDMSDSSAEPAIEPAFHHPESDFGPIPFWYFGSANACVYDQFACGSHYFIDGSLSLGSDDMLNIAYTDLIPSPDYMITLNQVDRVKIGELQVTMPHNPGTSFIDMLNANEPDDAFGAEFRFGFGTASDPLMVWRAEHGEITGGQLQLTIPEPSLLILVGVASGWFLRRHRGPELA